MSDTPSRYLVAAIGAWIDAWPPGVSHEEVARASRVVLDGSLLFVTVDDTNTIELRQLDPETRRVIDKARSWSQRHTTTTGRTGTDWEEPLLWAVCAIALVVLGILQLT